MNDIYNIYISGWRRSIRKDSLMILIKFVWPNGFIIWHVQHSTFGMWHSKILTVNDSERMLICIIPSPPTGAHYYYYHIIYPVHGTWWKCKLLNMSLSYGNIMKYTSEYYMTFLVKCKPERIFLQQTKYEEKKKHSKTEYKINQANGIVPLELRPYFFPACFCCCCCCALLSGVCIRHEYAVNKHYTSCVCVQHFIFRLKQFSNSTNNIPTCTHSGPWSSIHLTHSLVLSLSLLYYVHIIIAVAIGERM